MRLVVERLTLISKFMKNGEGIFLRILLISMNGKNCMVWLFWPLGKPRFSLFSLRSYIEESLAEIICLRGKLLIHQNASFVEQMIIWFIFSLQACPAVHKFLDRIKNWVRNVLGYDVEEILDKDYLLGLVGGGENGRTVNYVFLWAKFYIYRQLFFHNGLLDVYQWIWELLDRLAIEKYINGLEGGKKRKIPCEELISRIHGL